MNAHSMGFLGLVALMPVVAAAQTGGGKTSICLAPASVKATAGNSASPGDAVRQAFTSFLTGPSLSVSPLSARLESQTREEAKLAGCPFLLLTTVEHKRKQGSKFLNRVVGSAVQQGAWRAGAEAGGGIGRIAADAAAGAAGAAASDWAYTVKTKDELALTYRLETPDGAPLVEKKSKRKAESDGEDLLTPLVEQAAEAIADALAKRTR